MSDTYHEFLAFKRLVSKPVGIEVDPAKLNPMLFQFQRDVLRRGELRYGKVSLTRRASHELHRVPRTGSQDCRVRQRGGHLVALLRGDGTGRETVNKLKKVWRDDGGIVTEARCVEIVKELGGTLWYISQICSELGLSLDEVAQANLELLSDRHARGVINGDGDNR